MEEVMKLVIIDDQKGEADMLIFFAEKFGFTPAEHEVSIVWQIDSVQHAVEQSLGRAPDAIFVDWQFDDIEYPIPTGINGAKIVSALRISGYAGPIYSHASSGISNFEKAGVTHLMSPESTNKRPENFARIVAPRSS